MDDSVTFETIFIPIVIDRAIQCIGKDAKIPYTESLKKETKRNGIAYYNRSVNSYKESILEKHISNLLQDMKFVTVTFLFLLTMFNPLFIMSTDYHNMEIFSN